MQSLVDVLCRTYRARPSRWSRVAVPTRWKRSPEAGHGRRCLVIRNGLVSYRWSQTSSTLVPFRQRPRSAAPSRCPAIGAHRGYPLRSTRWWRRIERNRPHVAFAAHVETAAGLVLPDDYLRAVAAATHASWWAFVSICIASGCLWVDMTDLGIDVLLSAPQKGWSGSPCAGFVMLSEAGRAAVESTTSTSFAAGLRTWLTITEAYMEGRTPHHVTLPTDTLAHDATLMRQTYETGLDELQQAQIARETRARRLLADRGFPSVAARPIDASSVVVHSSMIRLSARRRAGDRSASRWLPARRHVR